VQLSFGVAQRLLLSDIQMDLKLDVGLKNLSEILNPKP
jgi:hypothetical protein